ncbi:MAG TPA: aldolase [Caldimonas sp.]|nr:aldolase [Caldimonas sp.]HEX2543028.1 aldolase [Caldimonas sp.]
MNSAVVSSLREAPPEAAAAADRDPRPALTRCAWILADEGHESGLAGQLTARGPSDGSFWTLPLGLAFDEAEEASWLLIDDGLNVLEGEGSYGIREPNPATRFHLWVYRARPDVRSIVHTHPPAASALAAAEQPLIVAHMDATPLFDDMAFLPDWPGLPTADREGEVIAGGLGGKHAMLLAHHGLLAAGRSVQEAAFLAVFIERMARQQLDAALVGGARPIDAGEARRARDFLRTDRIMNATFSAWSRRAERRRAG